VDEVLKYLEEECSVKAVAISAQSSYSLISTIKGIKAIFKFVLGIFLFEHSEVHHVADERHAFIDFFL
jgi:hypothetical protein